MSFEMEEQCENFARTELSCLHCTKEKIKIQGDICFTKKKKVKESQMQKTRTIRCKCGWVGKTEQHIDLLIKCDLEYLLKSHVAEKHYEEFMVVQTK